MTNPTTIRIAALGLLAGSLAIAPAARAQIAVNGGNASGQAAFFVPGEDAAGNVRLFDINVQRLRLETENGNTSTAVFTPNGALFNDTDSSGTANSGDQGTLRGTLSGLAFNQSGTAFPFSGANTVLNFTLSNFDDNIGNINGTLIRSDVAGRAPLIFLPGASDVNVITSGFSSSEGALEVGDFTAALDDGAIALPSSLQFREGSGGGGNLPPSNGLNGRFQFRFRGEDVTAGEDSDLDFSDGSIRFVSTANREFRIRSAGETRGRDGFKLDIRADVGAVDVTLGREDDAVNESFREIRIENGEIDLSESIDKFDIDGDAQGIFSFYGPTTVGFASTGGRNNTRFSFEQGDNKLRGRMAEGGFTSFYAAAGVTSLDDSVLNFSNFDAEQVTTTGGQGTSCNVCGTNLQQGETIAVGGSTIVIGEPINVGDDDDDDDDDFDGDDDFGDFDDDDDDDDDDRGNRGNRGNRNVRINTRNTTRIVFSSSSPSTTVLFTPVVVSGSSSATYQYQFLSAYRFTSFTNTTISQTRVQLVQRNGTRYYVVRPGRGLGRGVLTAFKQVGPGGRIFPGMGGYQQVSQQELQNVVLVGLEELDEDDTTLTTPTNTTTETTNTTGDDDADDIGDDDADDIGNDDGDDTLDDDADDIGDDDADDIGDDDGDDTLDDDADDIGDDDGDDTLDDDADDIGDDGADDIGDDDADDIGDDGADDIGDDDADDVGEE
jgi:hypothetical protein